MSPCKGLSEPLVQAFHRKLPACNNISHAEAHEGAYPEKRFQDYFVVPDGLGGLPVNGIAGLEAAANS
jgi:hypothetical protein